MSLWRRLFGDPAWGPHEAPKPTEITSEWKGIDPAKTEQFERLLKKPINILRTELPTPNYLSTGDSIIVYQHIEGRRIWETPPIYAERPMTVTHVTKFEVIDEFGDDVGIGVVLGGPKL